MPGIQPNAGTGEINLIEFCPPAAASPPALFQSAFSGLNALKEAEESDLEPGTGVCLFVRFFEED